MTLKRPSLPAGANTKKVNPLMTCVLKASALALLLAAGLGQAQTASHKEVDRAATRETLVIPGKGVSVYAAGDIADCRRLSAEDSGAAKTARLIADALEEERDAAVLALGDNTYPIGLLQEFTDCYGPTWGQFKKRTHPTPGNHEYYSPEAAGYYRYFGAAAGTARRGYYSKRIGAWHVLSLNSNLNPELHAEQIAWLKKDLADNGRACTLAFWHHPRHSSGGHGSSMRMDDAWRILAEHGADVVLAAHDHQYERFAPLSADGEPDPARGMRSFVVGTGGARLTPLRFPRPHSEAVDNTSLGVLKLNLKPTGYEWEFLPVEKDGFSERGAARCNNSK